MVKAEINKKMVTYGLFSFLKFSFFECNFSHLYFGYKINVPVSFSLSQAKDAKHATFVGFG